MKPVAIDLDALGDTRPLWNDWLEDAARRFRVDLGARSAELPEDRAAAAEQLDDWAKDGSVTGGPLSSGSPRNALPST